MAPLPSIKSRHIVERKDFTVSDASVGLPKIRSFFAVIHDISPERRDYIVSATGFTKPTAAFVERTLYQLGRYIQTATLSAPRRS